MKAKRPIPPALAINWLMATLTLIAIPHFVHLPLWLPVIFMAIMCWRLMNSWRGWPLPADHLLLRAVHLLLAAIAIGLVLGHYGMTIARDAGVALLTVLLAFKLLETRDVRDFYLCCFLGFFLIATHFFFQQSMFTVLLMLINVVLLTNCLIVVNDSTSSAKQRFKTASILLLQATPMMLLLFVLFPRVPGPLWGVANDYVEVTDTMPSRMTLGGLPSVPQGQTGISEAMQVGRISDLVQSDATAFRVRFSNDEIPDNQSLYWRGPVLWHTDGEQWQALAPELQSRYSPEISFNDAQRIDYTVTMERHNQNWLFALDFPDTMPDGITASINSNGSLVSNEAVRKRSQFNLRSGVSYQLNPTHEPLLAYALELPDAQHPKTRQMAQDLRAQYPDKQDYVRAVLRYFSEQPFYYTLSPPLLSGDIIDSFLFDSRHGFCEHYAASFTVLMRAADIPARVVIGYQGGDINPVDQVMTVRQRDAHAWSEIWIAGVGWTRVDPTSAVASERVLSGMRGLLPAERRSPRVVDYAGLEAVWQNMRDHWEAVNNAWEMWVVGYDTGRQVELLRKLGMSNPNWQTMAQWLAAGILIIFAGLAWLTLRHRQSREPITAAYQQFCQYLADNGVSINATEGPSSLAQRASKQMPHAANEISAIIADYIAARYQNIPQAEVAFIDKVKRFRQRL